MPTREQAQHWLERWDRQQATFLVDREERFAVIADVVEATAGRPDPLVVDLGVGPGSLAVRLLDRLPGARVVGIDTDPVLLGLAQAAYGDRRGLRLVDHDLRIGGWVDALGLDRAPDAFVSTTALHWLSGEELAAVYAGAGSVLRPGGVVVNGDHLFDGPVRPGLDALTRSVKRRAADAGVPAGEDWAAWWQAVERAPELADLVAERAARAAAPAVSGFARHVDQAPTLDEHVQALHDAGFAEVGTVWQFGNDRVLAALR
jgi:SAM-dependent methyltransferase